MAGPSSSERRKIVEGDTFQNYGGNYEKYQQLCITEVPQKNPDNFKLFKKAKIWRLISQIWLMIFQIFAALSVSYSSIWKSWNCQYFWLWFKMFWCAIHTPVLHIYIYWRNFISGWISKNLPHLRFHIYLTKIFIFA